MRILAITAFFPPFHHGGYELRCKDVLNGLKQKGHEICVITNQVVYNNVSEKTCECWVHRILNNGVESSNVFAKIRSDKKDLQRIEKIIESFKPDLIYLWHLQNLSDTILPYLAKHELPIVYDEGGSGLIYLTRLQKRGLYFYKNDQDGKIKRWLKQGIKVYARVISGGRIVPDWNWPSHMRIYFNSLSALKHARESGVPVDGAEIISSGVDLSKFPVKNKVNIKTPIKIVIPARIKAQKGCIDGIQLVDELRRRNVLSSLLILGEVQDSTYFDEINKTISGLGLGNFVQIRSMLSQEALSEVYRIYDVCFFPSYFKTGFSRVSLEAMASGCLVVTYGNEGSGGVVIQGETGVLIKEGDVSSAADWLQRLIAIPLLYQRIINSARQLVEKDFSMESYIQKIESFLILSCNNFRSV